MRPSSRMRKVRNHHVVPTQYLLQVHLPSVIDRLEPNATALCSIINDFILNHRLRLLHQHHSHRRCTSSQVAASFAHASARSVLPHCSNFLYPNLVLSSIHVSHPWPGRGIRRQCVVGWYRYTSRSCHSHSCYPKPSYHNLEASRVVCHVRTLNISSTHHRHNSSKSFTRRTENSRAHPVLCPSCLPIVCMRSCVD